MIYMYILLNIVFYMLKIQRLFLKNIISSFSGSDATDYWGLMKILLQLDRVGLLSALFFSILFTIIHSTYVAACRFIDEKLIKDFLQTINR